MSKVPLLSDLHVFFLTVGESVSKDSLDALIKYTPQPYKLTIWYDSCGREIDWNFYESLREYTDDVILVTKNHGTVGALSYALLYLDGKYIMIVLADTVVREGYLDRFSDSFFRIKKLACAGSFRYGQNVPWDFLINSKQILPDGVQVFSKEAINEIGGYATAFKGMGQENREWHERALAKGWSVVTCNGIMDEIGSMHDGRNMNPKASEEIEESSKVYLRIKDNDWKDFNWWDNRWNREKCETNEVSC